jgi:hypothetical protein
MPSTAKSEERTFTQDEVTAIVKKRLGQRGLNDEVIIEMLRNIVERLEAIEKQR